LKLKNNQLKYWEKCRNANLNFKLETMLKNDQDQFQMIIQTCPMLQMLWKHARTWKKMIKAQALETLKWKCKGERLEKRVHHKFLYWFTQTWATSSLSRQPELDFALFQKFYKESTLTLPKYTKTPQKTLESHKNHTSTARTLLHTWKTTRHTHKAWERSNLCGSTT